MYRFQLFQQSQTWLRKSWLSILGVLAIISGTGIAPGFDQTGSCQRYA